MGKIIESTYVTLDGVQDEPQQWSFDYFDDKAGAFALERLLGAEALLMGRRTYDGFAEAWTQRSGDEFSDKFNSMKKYVASSTLIDPTWNNTTVLGADVAGEVAKLKTELDGDILMYGHGPVARLLLEHNLLDELHLWIHPLFWGKGAPADLLFQPAAETRLALSGTTVLDSGVVILSYVPA
ncbi:dihydrofolate reductase family protein [Antrihabitans sp. YC2-6]|uniref:dihydrofolate reductase family protein n=1 Tax=Antrihabitans sp. YC2-6 TaxID=2799498 RepID=UPI0018F53515|nr:dihydrofolate reductase family protein [Antrihabitans sp. YC2-6]MBJ8346425.1 dihydrofolate reductase family protein [Antrihabitans sp. YC2-6]